MKKRFIAKNFAAVDFEMANMHRASICSIGVVVVRDWHVTDRLYRLVRPVPGHYSAWATRVHGLGDNDTGVARDFPLVWEEIRDVVHDLPMVAHNSAFEQDCLRSVHAFYGLVYHGHEFHCTYRTAAGRVPWLRNHRLHTVCAYFGHVSRFRHESLADAEGCAFLARLFFS
ncbi:MAG: 3'-5' exoribonuclease [Odoribacteraceae bacterium]|jgi:DNA polymerase-3 subunit epsilon|nr:3'-5' exoribonuclease [Odoribacteraceae bacterium]